MKSLLQDNTSVKLPKHKCNYDKPPLEYLFFRWSSASQHFTIFVNRGSRQLFPP